MVLWQPSVRKSIDNSSAAVGVEMDRIISKTRWILGGGLLFLFSCLMCFDELQYQITGQETVASIHNIYQSASRRGMEQKVEYIWVEPDGNLRKSMFTTSLDWVQPDDGKLRILYTPGVDGKSRLLGHPPWFWIGSFVISLSVIGFFIFKIQREASDDRPKKPLIQFKH
jgi:hypothetical protein